MINYTRMVIAGVEYVMIDGLPYRSLRVAGQPCYEFAFPLDLLEDCSEKEKWLLWCLRRNRDQEPDNIHSDMIVTVMQAISTHGYFYISEDITKALADIRQCKQRLRERLGAWFKWFEPLEEVPFDVPKLWREIALSPEEGGVATDRVSPKSIEDLEVNVDTQDMGGHTFTSRPDAEPDSGGNVDRLDAALLEPSRRPGQNTRDKLEDAAAISEKFFGKPRKTRKPHPR